VRLGARLGEFAGWRLPIRYPEGTLAEHQHTREAASLFDVCHMGELRVRGPGAGLQLDRLLARGVADQPVNTCRYNFLTNEQGGVRDDLLVYRLAEDEFLLVVNAGTARADAAWIGGRLAKGVSLNDESADTAKLDLQGPRSFEVLHELGWPRQDVPGYYRFRRGRLGGCDVLVSRTGYTGERGVEIYAASAAAPALWDRLLAHPLASPAGLGARDTLRLEMGYPLYGHELDQDTTPIEAGFGRFVDPDRGRFVGCDALRGPPRKRLTGFRLEGRRAARGGAHVWEPGGRRIGVVTSGAYAPSLGRAVALGFVFGAAEVASGTPVALGDSPARAIPAAVSPLPFYTHGTARRPDGPLGGE